MRVTIALLVAAIWWFGAPPPAGAAGDGGAASSVTGDGRIITTIFGPRTGGGGRSSTVRSYWVTLSASQFAYVLQVVSTRPDLGVTPIMEELRARIAGGYVDGIALQYRVLDGRPTGEVRIIDTQQTTSSTWSRQMVTSLPALRPTITPPASLTIPIGEPVFFSYTPDVWGQVVDRTLTAYGVTARVRAWPIRFEVRSGDPATVGRILHCPGRGRPFDPRDPASPPAQARRADSCTLIYRSGTGAFGRPDAWVGDITVTWWAEWTTDGRRWLPLGEIPTLSLIRRPVREVLTDLESAP